MPKAPLLPRLTKRSGEHCKVLSGFALVKDPPEDYPARHRKD